jgi:Ca2+-binding EF-hand superfamily protein
MRFCIAATILAATFVLSGTTLAAQDRDESNGQAQMRFKGMDRNGDGRITRAEWHGSAKSFKEHDWNGDGVLSGQEVREGAKRQGHSKEHEKADDDRDNAFQNWDDNRDGRIARSEWRGTAERFAVLDRDRNGFLTENEAEGNEPPADLFSSVDVNRDGSIARQEWQWSQPSFDQRDTNRDGRLSREEFAASSSPSMSRSPSTPSRSPSGGPSFSSATSRAGWERGMEDGRQAGKEDGARHQWDLEGQRELEQADAGYHAGLGPRAEYQAGYREGFRQAYREGFGR